MKTKTKKVYYCDFCKKRGLSPGAMKNHEKHCTGNINRTCRMCENQIDYEEVIAGCLKKLKEQIPQSAFDEYILDQEVQKHLRIVRDDVIDNAEGCPACVLTILRQLTKVLPVWFGGFEYEYKKEVENWWAEVNANKEPGYSCYC